jgi:hypothetical protein
VSLVAATDARKLDPENSLNPPSKDSFSTNCKEISDALRRQSAAQLRILTASCVLGLHPAPLLHSAKGPNSSECFCNLISTRHLETLLEFRLKIANEETQHDPISGKFATSAAERRVKRRLATLLLVINKAY